LVDALRSGRSGIYSRGGSSPLSSTKQRSQKRKHGAFGEYCFVGGKGLEDLLSYFVIRQLAEKPNIQKVY